MKLVNMNVTETLNYYCTYIYARIYFYVKQICLFNGDFSILESRQIYQQNKDIFLTFNFLPAQGAPPPPPMAVLGKLESLRNKRI